MNYVTVWLTLAPASCPVFWLRVLHLHTCTAQAIAEQYLPRIDNPGGMELVVEDAAGDKYTLRFRCVLPVAVWASETAAPVGSMSALHCGSMPCSVCASEGG